METFTGLFPALGISMVSSNPSETLLLHAERKEATAAIMSIFFIVSLNLWHANYNT